MTVLYPFRKILVPTDFSTCADSALDLAGRLAAEHGSTVVLLHVADVRGVPLDAIVLPPGQPAGIDVRTHVSELAHDELDRRLASLPPEVPTRVKHLAFGSVDRTIVKLLSEIAPDLVVMGTHGRTGLAHFLMGSIAERVLRASSVPVMVVREPSYGEHDLTPALDGEAEG